MINENLKYPITYHSRRSHGGSMKRGSIYSVNTTKNSKLNKKINEELCCIDNAEYFYLIDMNNDDIICCDFINEKEANNRNTKLDNFMWIK